MLVPVIFPPITTEPPGEHKVPPDLRNRAIRLIERQADNLFLSKSSDNEAIVAGKTFPIFVLRTSYKI